MSEPTAAITSLGVDRPDQVRARATNTVPRRTIPTGVGRRPGVAVDRKGHADVGAGGLGCPIEVAHHRPVQRFLGPVGDGNGAGERPRPRRRAARCPRGRGTAARISRLVTEPELPRDARLVGVRRDRDGRAGGGVGRPVAVVVDAVEGHLRHAGVDRRARVVAVGAGGRVATGHRTRHDRAGGRAVGIAICVEVVGAGRETVIHHSVAVVIGRVAGLGRSGVNRRARVVAVGRVRHPSGRSRASGGGAGCVAVAVAVGVPVERGHHTIIDAAVAVVIDRVAGLHGAAVHGGVGVVAVGRVRLAVTVAVRIGIRGVAAVAVLVEAVRRHVGGAGVDAVVAVVAVGTGGDAFRGVVVTVAVPVGIGLAGREGVGRRGTGEGVRVAVVAVGPVRDEAGGRFARRDRVGGVTEVVPVLVRVPGVGVHGVVVDVDVAVVVDPVAGLDHRGVDRGRTIVAVAVVVRPPGGDLADQGHRTGTVAVAVHVAIGLDARSTDAVVAVVTVPIDTGETGPGADTALHAGRTGADAIVVRIDVGGGVVVGDRGVVGPAVVDGDLGRRGDAVPAHTGIAGRDAEAGRRGPVEGVSRVDGVGVVAVRVGAVRLAHELTDRIDAVLDGRPGGDALRGRDDVAVAVANRVVGRGVGGTAGDREEADQGKGKDRT